MTATNASSHRSPAPRRIVHLGLGAFHRAHQALYTQDAGGWGICGVSLFSTDLITQLRQLGHVYTVLEKTGDSHQVKKIDVIDQTLHPALDGAAAVVARMAEADVAIVSLTVTEKGYCLNAATGQLDRNNPLIQHDIAHPDQPQSAPGFIVAALAARKAAGLPPFSVLSCDNMPHNGQVARSVITGLAAAQSAELASWIEQHVTFPSSMVDRIVPAATAESLAEIASLTGHTDPCAISCEPFTQWVIEDNFCQGRPDWDNGGAQFVHDVTPFEEMKLRMLNGSHSFLAYLGYLAGYKTIADTMQDAAFLSAARQLMLQEQAPTLSMPAGTDLNAYADQLIARFSNTALKHQTWQIAMDGSQKLPQRMVRSVEHHLAQGTDYRHLALGIAGWMRYVSGEDEQGNPIDVRDPMREALQTIYQQHGVNAQVVAPLLAQEAIFGRVLPQNADFIEAVTQAYQSLLTHGARHSVAALNTPESR